MKNILFVLALTISLSSLASFKGGLQFHVLSELDPECVRENILASGVYIISSGGTTQRLIHDIYGGIKRGCYSKTMTCTVPSGDEKIVRFGKDEDGQPFFVIQ